MAFFPDPELEPDVKSGQISSQSELNIEYIPSY